MSTQDPPSPNGISSGSRRENGQADSNSPAPTAPFAWLRPYVSENRYEFITSNLGLLFVAGAQFFFACMNISVKYFLSVTPMAVTTLILVRMGITSLCGIAALYIMGDPHPFFGPPEYRRLLLFRGLAGFVGLFTAYKSYTGLSVSDSTAIQYLTPSLTVIFAFLFLGERIARREVLAGLTCLGGVLLISRPPMIFGGSEGEGAAPDEGGAHLPGSSDLNRISRMEGVAWALLSVCGATTAYLLIRKLGPKVNALHTLSIFAHMCTLFSFFLTIVNPGAFQGVKTLNELFLILMIGVFGFIAQILLTMGLQRERVGKAGVALYLSVFYSIILELLVFHTFPAFLSLVGIAVILSAAFWVAKGNAKDASDAKIEREADLESAPISRSTTPLADPSQRAIRGGHHDYFSVPKSKPDGNGEGGYLKVSPTTRRGRSGSEISGFTSVSSSPDGR